jgi:hypothetical protein
VPRSVSPPVLPDSFNHTRMQGQTWKIKRPTVVSCRMNEMGKLLVVAGLLLAAVGALLWSGYGRGWMGRLPGDIHYSRGHFSFYFPIVTCLLVSAILTLLLWLFRK